MLSCLAGANRVRSGEHVERHTRRLVLEVRFRAEDSLPGRDFANWTSLCINWVTNFETSNVDDWNVAS